MSTVHQSRSNGNGITRKGRAIIEYVKGDMFKANIEALVNTVTCVGVMGRGIALQFKQAFPEKYKA